MYKMMLFRLYLPPIILGVFSILAFTILDNVIPDMFSSSGLLSALGDQAKALAPIAFYVLILIAIGWSLACTYRLWCWDRGSAESCHNCGGMVNQKSGRYGLYFKCLACGNNRSY